jgi:hypothetical protein
MNNTCVQMLYILEAEMIPIAKEKIAVEDVYPILSRVALSESYTGFVLIAFNCYSNQGAI